MKYLAERTGDFSLYTATRVTVILNYLYLGAIRTCIDPKGNTDQYC